MKLAIRIALGLSLVWLIYFAKAHVAFRFYPVAMNLIFFFLFALSLFRTPLVEIFARRMGERLDARGIVYCRKVTLAWVVFLFLNTSVSLATVFLSRELWAIYNGCVSYVLMGLMFAVEFFVRRRVRHD